MSNTFSPNPDVLDSLDVSSANSPGPDSPRGKAGRRTEKGLRDLLLPLASLVLVLGLGTLMGFSALLVPGVVFLLVFGQALPAMIFEGTNVRGSLAASWRLTPGNILSLLGLTLILLSLAFVPSFLSYLVSKAAGPGASLVIVLPTIAVTLILFFLLSCLWPLVALIVYQDLCALKDRPAEVVAPEPAPEPLPAA